MHSPKFSTGLIPAFFWMKDYLANRRQYVSFNFVDSSQQENNCGVPQGSFLGPLLLELHIYGPDLAWYAVGDLANDFVAFLLCSLFWVKWKTLILSF